MRSAAVVVASTRAAAGVYQDRSGRIAADWFGSHGFEVEGPFVVADGEDVRAQLRRLLVERPPAGRPAVVVTSGGTGLSPDDLTPDNPTVRTPRDSRAGARRMGHVRTAAGKAVAAGGAA